MATAGDQIKAALRLLGVLASGENPEAIESIDALAAFNQMLDSWSTERLSVFCTIDTTVTWPSGQASQTVGPLGDFYIAPCPVLIDDSTYYKVGDLSYNLNFINQNQYNSIAMKGSTSTLPSVMFVNRVPGESEDKIRLTIWPVPTQDLELHIISVSPLTQIADVTDNLVYPQGYLRAVKYNLAVELAPEFGVEASRTVKQIARDSKRNLKRINNPGDVMGMPGALIWNGRFNIYTGGFQ